MMKHAKRCESKDPRSGRDSLEVWADSSPVYAAAQQQHAATTEQLRSQLAACTETHRNLERETVVLTHLEAMMPHCDPTLSNSLWNLQKQPSAVRKNIMTSVLYDLSRRYDVTPELTRQNFEIKEICT